MKKVLLSLCFALLGSSAFASEYLGVQALGTTKLSWGGDHDTVSVTSCARGFKVDAVQLKVSRNVARIDYIALQYANGETEELRVRRRFNPGEPSRWIDLGRFRCIRSFEVYGETLGIPIKKTRITLFGQAYSI